MLNPILVDSGPLIALFDRDDHFHNKVKEFIQLNRFKFITTTAVVTEVTDMLDFSTDTQIDFLHWIIGRGVKLFDINQNDIGRIIELTSKYSDVPMDFADATLVVVAEKTNVRKIISIDSDFDIYRLPSKVRIENIFKFV